LSTIASVASFFVSRVDTEVDNRLEAIGTPQAMGLRGKAALANARLAYGAYQEVFGVGSRWAGLAEDGAKPQRPLWASTGVKNPNYPDTMYVTELVAPNTVNTMPEKTMDAVAEHGECTGDTVSDTAVAGQQVFDALDGGGHRYHRRVPHHRERRCGEVHSVLGRARGNRAGPTRQPHRRLTPTTPLAWGPG